MTEPLFSEDEEFDRPRLAAHGPVRVRVPAKINLHLHVGPTRPDGYHELTTVYHAIGLYDEITARRGDTLTLTMEGEGTGELSLGEDNLVVRAVRALAAETGHDPHARLHLKKQIPIAAGLAGGSADAAAALVACDQLWGTGMSRDDLAVVAATLGSDIPFLVLGGTALGTGRGELVSPILTGGHTWHWVLAVAEEGLSTPVVYRAFDELGGRTNAGPPDGLMAALRQRDPEVLAGELANDLQAAALHLRPELQQVLDAGIEAGALAGLISGSGPTCVFLAEDGRHAALIAADLEERRCCRAVRTAVGPVPGARVL
ncbi:4-(cytidine 5'-diphospho)-2-C-methyl-D-erythritol kinase [Dactylosporangium salmoneum]|uniref:4-diphosphocytidyl-2-C-methyl-D-erythritol kinase n=1 Tax=Dactylosporangium salmoneum TaxID=53361 RepID=A0ABP5UMJ3_9ACTN